MCRSADWCWALLCGQLRLCLTFFFCCCFSSLEVTCTSRWLLSVAVGQMEIKPPPAAPLSREVGTAGRAACLIWQRFTSDALPDGIRAFRLKPCLISKQFSWHFLGFLQFACHFVTDSRLLVDIPCSGCQWPTEVFTTPSYVNSILPSDWYFLKIHLNVEAFHSHRIS